MPRAPDCGCHLYEVGSQHTFPAGAPFFLTSRGTPFRMRASYRLQRVWARLPRGFPVCLLYREPFVADLGRRWRSHKASLRHLWGTLAKRSMKISGVAKRGGLIHGQGLGRLGRRSNGTRGTPPHAIGKLSVTTYRPFPLRQRLRRPTPAGRRRHFSTSPTGPPPGYEPRYGGHS